MRSKSLITIGGGIAGLSMGCYAQMNGFRSTVLEMNKYPGGHCTTWKRKDFTIDNCVHWLHGCNPTSNFGQFWKELGVVGGKMKQTIDDIYSITSDWKGNKIHWYMDPNKLEAELNNIAKEDQKEIKVWIKDIKKMQHLLATMKQSLSSIFKLFSFVKLLKKYQISPHEFAKRNFKSPILKESFGRFFGFGDFPMQLMMLSLGDAPNKNLGYPEGGSQALTNAIKARQSELGGNLKLSKKVEKIIVKNDKAVGVKLSDGEEIFADIIVSACDAKTSLQNLLDGKQMDAKIEEIFNRKFISPLFEVVLGLNNVYDIPHSIIGNQHLLKDPQKLENQTTNELFYSLKTHKHRPFMAPKGKSILLCGAISDYDFWAKFKNNRSQQNLEKRKQADILISKLESLFPDIRGHIDMLDIITPVTYERYTGNWKGVFMTFYPSTHSELISKESIIRPPKLKNFYMTGMWAFPPGGLPVAANGSRFVMGKICKDFGKKFQTSLPTNLI